MQILINGLSRSLVINLTEEHSNILSIKECIERIEGIPVLEQRLVLNTKPLCDSFCITSEDAKDLPPLHLSLRLLGGKGGFGALLRGQGAKAGAKRTTNFDDCRDLNGNRIRNLKNEKKLTDWYQEQQTQKEAEERKKKTEVVKVTKVTDVKYTTQLKENEEVIAQSLEKGLKKQQELNKQQQKSDNIQVNKKPRLFWSPFGDEDEEDELTAFSESVIDAKNKANENGEESLPVDQEVESSANSNSITTSDTEEPPVDLNVYESPDLLEILGMEKLKKELTERGLPCGGTLKERAQRLFSIKGKTDEEIEQMKKKSKKRKAKN